MYIEEQERNKSVVDKPELNESSEVGREDLEKENGQRLRDSIRLLVS